MLSVCVKKFGGTSVGSLERISWVADRIKADRSRGEMPVVVASAMAGETNRLVDLAEQAFPGYRGSAYDMLLASGEQVSISLLAMALEKRGVRARPYLAHQLGIWTNSMYSRARIQHIDTQILKRDLEDGIVPVIAGFQGIDDSGLITTLGRGGSDTTGVALAAALNASSCEIYTDVPAVFTADPRLVPKAREISKLSFEEMMELASLGAKILHIRSVEIAAKFQVRLHVRSTFEMRDGTWIVPESEIMENPVVSAVSHETSTCVIKAYPIAEDSDRLASFFEALAERGIVVDIITQSQSELGQRLAFSVNIEDREDAVREVQKHFPNAGEVEIMNDVSKVSIVGVGMRNHPGVAARFFRALANIGVKLHLVTTSEIKVSAVIDRQFLEKSVQALHTIFDLDQA